MAATMSRRTAVTKERYEGPERVPWKKKVLAWVIILLMVSTAAISLLYYLFQDPGA